MGRAASRSIQPIVEVSEHERQADQVRGTLRILCVAPFLNEERYLGRFLESVEHQIRMADEMILVDDGSVDASWTIAAQFAQRHPAVRLLRRPPRPPERDRLASAHELQAFQWAVSQAEGAWDIAVKLDTDLVLNLDLFDALERAFLEQPDLGIGGAYLSVIDPSTTAQRREATPAGHVRGATKFYRRECYTTIAPLPAILGWDTIDEVTARSRGWRTGSIECPGGDIIHLRPTGAADGLLRAQFRWGTCAYAIGQHPLWIAASAVRRLQYRPRVLASLAYIAGSMAAFRRRYPRASAEVRAYGRREDLQRLRSLLLHRYRKR